MEHAVSRQCGVIRALLSALTGRHDLDLLSSSCIHSLLTVLQRSRSRLRFLRRQLSHGAPGHQPRGPGIAAEACSAG